MKNTLKIILLTVVAIAAGACDTQEELDKNQEYSIWSDDVSINDYINEGIGAFEDFAPQNIEELLCDKVWTIWTYLDYEDSEYTQFRNVLFFRGEYNSEMLGGSPHKYTYEFKSDGTLIYDKDGDNKTRRWSFDPLTKVVTITRTLPEGSVSISRHIRALGDSRLIWEYGVERGYPHPTEPLYIYYVREEYIPQESAILKER